MEGAELEGMDLHYVNKPPDELLCSICLFVYREPVLTSCCGNHFCHSCVEQVKVEHRPCPLCAEEKFTTLLDKNFVRKVKELEVTCEHKDNGCLWQGCVDALKRHLDPVKGDCKYMRTECPYFCGTIMNCFDLGKHQKVCDRRPYSCKFCSHMGVYGDMSAKHWKMCEKYPLPCPNECGEVDIERCSMEIHLKEKCSLQKSNCEFEYAGCTVCLNSRDMSEHLANSVHLHLSLVSKHCINLSRAFPMELRTQIEGMDSENRRLRLRLKKNEDDISLLQSKVESLTEELDDIRSDTMHLKSTVFVPPFKFIMTDFRMHKQNQEQWLSPPFYTHFGGYRMCISVDASGLEEGQDTHISVYANLMKGEHDNHLKWPFVGCVLIQLLNQREDSGHFQERITFTYDASEIAGRVMGGEVAETGLGIPTFIKHTSLGYNSKKNIEYLKYDCLHFRVMGMEGMEYMHRSKSNQGLK